MGLRKLVKLYGRMTIKANGKSEVWVWDYAKDEPFKESEMTKERFAESEKAKAEIIKKGINENIKNCS